MEHKSDKVYAIVEPSAIYHPQILNQKLPFPYVHVNRFDYPKKGEYFLTTNGYVDQAIADSPRSVDCLRLILKKITRKQVIFTVIRSDSQPNNGEWYSKNLGREGIHLWDATIPRAAWGGPDDLCTIYKREEKEV